MNEALLDYLITLFSLLILGGLIINGVVFLRWGYRKLRRSGMFMVLILVAGCINGPGTMEEDVPVTTTSATAVYGKAPSFEDTPEGLKSALASGHPVLLEFTATWCPNCPEQEDIIGDIQSEYPYLVVIHIDVDEYPDTADQYIVGYMPTTIIFNDQGEKIAEFIGLTFKGDLAATLDLL